MDRKYPNALAYIKIEAVIRVKQKLWAVKIWAKMIWKQPNSLQGFFLEMTFKAHSGNYFSKQPFCVKICHWVCEKRELMNIN